MRGTSTSIIGACLLAGCGTPSVTYHLASSDEVPARGSFAFQLRASDITLLAPLPAQAQQVSADPIQAHNPKPEQAKDGITATASAAIVRDQCGHQTSWVACLQGVKAISTAATFDSETYVMAPKQGILGLYETDIGKTSVDSNELLIKSVTVNFKDNRKQVITNVGGGAVTGFGFGGIPGAAVGALVGLAEGLGQRGGKPAHEEKFEGVDELICASDKETQSWHYPFPPAPKLVLPIIIGHDSYVGDTQSKDMPGCWHTLPNNSGIDQFTIVDEQQPAPQREVAGDGWLYRIIKGEAHSNTIKRNDYFNLGTSKEVRNDSAVKNDFPYSSCRSLEVQVVWWQVLDSAREARVKNLSIDDRAKLTLSDFKSTLASYAVKVADPDNLGVAGLPDAGEIDLLSICGANIVTTKYVTNSAKDLIDEAVKQVGDFKAAQDKKNKVTTPTVAKTAAQGR